MKEKMAAVTIFAAVLLFVCVNTVVLSKEAENLLVCVEELDLQAPGAILEVNKIHENFLEKEKYMSISINHEDMTNIEQAFAEMIGALAVGDYDAAQIAKYRLTDALRHLRRLSGISLDAII